MSTEADKKGSFIPDKLYFKIGEVADIVGVKPYVLRYWETEFPDIAPGKSKSQQRLYKRKEVEMILLVRDLLYKEKFTIEGARRRLKESGKRGRAREKETHQQQMALPMKEASTPKEFLGELKKQLLELEKILEDI